MVFAAAGVVDLMMGRAEEPAPPKRTESDPKLRVLEVGYEHRAQHDERVGTAYSVWLCFAGQCPADYPGKGSQEYCNYVVKDQSIYWMYARIGQKRQVFGTVVGRMKLPQDWYLVHEEMV